ncbi:PREDICTED: brain-specific angiogenesis inhibitor 1-associated protein 2-like [Miniopterus natalensis]|uniref:brain-specific angiogenesis inhibitor 1-associated protein 2-like n=1 Tax=Miniopterus natalensis TaxID=291302 RepID=UPI0007A6D341|nr:PREDICTED: brain-specific angiogenesis inhibitor 1-associated protein 2-like [Miniopterus natalensis]
MFEAPEGPRAESVPGGDSPLTWLLDSQGDVLFQMAEVHRQIQNQLEEMLKSFHNELLTQLEQKVELDSRYLSAALKKYQTEQRSKGDALDKCQAELKKLRKKSQGSKNPQKYSDKELQVGPRPSAGAGLQLERQWGARKLSTERAETHVACTRPLALRPRR